jgi:anti-sigma factor RsiW
MRTHPTDSQLNNLIDGALPELRRMQFEKHIGTCPSCHDRYTLLLATVRRIRALPRRRERPRLV